MAELEKLRRIVERTPGALKEVLLVLDATTGQNGLTQARQFAEAVDVTGVVLTKLDGTAKGGIVLAIEAELGIPVKLVGVGERSADLVEFDPETFVGARCSTDRHRGSVVAWASCSNARRPFRRHLHEAPQPRASSPTRRSTRSRASCASRCSRPTSTSSSPATSSRRVKERGAGRRGREEPQPRAAGHQDRQRGAGRDPRRHHRQAHRRRRSRRAS